MSASSLIRECFWPRDGRSSLEIKASVREELDGHIERLVEEQMRAGVPESEARRVAAQQFGDVERYAAECRRIDLGERLVVRLALTAACLLLLATSGYFAWRLWQSEQLAGRLRAELAAANSKPAESGDQTAMTITSRRAWVERIVSLRDHMSTAFGVGPELTRLDPDEGLAIVREAWLQITRADVKTGLLKTFEFSKELPNKHPRLFRVLDLGMNDADPAVRRYASAYLQDYAGKDFSERPDDYAAWYRANGERTPEEVVRSLGETNP